MGHECTIIKKFIADNNLLAQGAKYIVALSGGADSVALLLAMVELGYDIDAAHCNFHLRGKESDRDEAFVKELCQAKGITLHVAHFDTHEYAALHHLSIEMAARKLRYGYFEDLRRDIGAKAICVAHHRDDNVETILMNLTRGTGINGLTGIKPRNGNIVRPLLCVCRKDIERYLAHRHQPYVTDSTNLEADGARRNKFRLEIIPTLRQVNPSLSSNILATSARLAECQKMADYAFAIMKTDIAESKDEGIDIDIAKLKASPSSEYILFKILASYGFSPQQVESVNAMLNAQTGKTVSSTSHELAFSRGKILVREKSKPMPPMRILEEGTYNLPNGTKMRVEVTGETNISRCQNIATMDADKVSFPLTIRPTEIADRFHPFGMKGTKLISDYLTDAKKNTFEKRSQLVAADAKGDIIWLIGERTDDRYCVDNATRRMLKMSFAPKQ